MHIASSFSCLKQEKVVDWELRDWVLLQETVQAYNDYTETAKILTCIQVHEQKDLDFDERNGICMQ